MAYTPSKFLASDSHIFLRDWQHAARTFVDDQFRLAPKFSFQFHVSFNINPEACKFFDLTTRHKNEINLLVKTVNLPKFTIDTVEANQYNRKKVIQTQHRFNDITIKFHDDNMGLINQLWQNYYSYYYADSTSAKAPGSYNRNATRNSDFITTKYGLDNGSTAPFFNYIKIYQMARHEYVAYKLYNPLIKSWDHKEVSYSSRDTHDFSMQLVYEAVSYETGTVNSDNVEGFALEHYDQSPSPLTGENANLGASPTFVGQEALENVRPEALSNTVKAINSYQNGRQPGISGTPGMLQISPNQNTGGIQDISFPQTSTGNTATTTAQKINLNI